MSEEARMSNLVRIILKYQLYHLFGVSFWANPLTFWVLDLPINMQNEKYTQKKTVFKKSISSSALSSLPTVKFSAVIIIALYFNTVDGLRWAVPCSHRDYVISTFISLIECTTSKVFQITVYNFFIWHLEKIPVR